MIQRLASISWIYSHLTVISALIYLALIPHDSLAESPAWKMREETQPEPGIIKSEYVATDSNHKIWLYRPKQQSNEPLPLIVIGPAGGNMITAPPLGEGDVPEHLPYVKAGYAVVSYSIEGQVTGQESDDEFVEAMMRFVKSRAGVESGRQAIDFALNTVSIDPKRIYAAGHSSSGTMALLLAAADDRVRAVAAYAPVTDVRKSLGVETVRELIFFTPIYNEFLTDSSPISHIESYQVPIFLFHAKGDQAVDPEHTLELYEKLKTEGRQVERILVEDGDHYYAMINQGIDEAIKWFGTLE